MTDDEFNKLTPYQQEQIRFQGWVIVALERVYDALLFNAMALGASEESITGLLADHKEHKYLFPEPGNSPQPGDDESVL